MEKATIRFTHEDGREILIEASVNRKGDVSVEIDLLEMEKLTKDPTALHAALARWFLESA